MTKDSSLLLLGAGGFIGSHLVSRLLRSTSARVTGVDVNSAKLTGLIGQERFTFVETDVCETDRIAPLIDAADTVISLVAICNPSLYNTTPLDVIDINFTRQLDVIKRCAQQKKRLIHFSTCEVYGRTAASCAGNGRADGDAQQYLLAEDSTPLIMGPIPAQRWSYATAKQLVERVLYAYGIEAGLEYTIVRPFNFIGPRMDFIPGVDGAGIPRVLACFMEALLCGRPLRLVANGQSRRCFTYIDDAIDALMLILEHREAARQQIFNIGHPGNEITIAKLAHTMIDMYRRMYPQFARADFGPCSVSAEEFYGRGYEDSDRRVPDITKARTLLGWEPQIGLEGALRESMSWFVHAYRDVCRCQKVV